MGCELLSMLAGISLMNLVALITIICAIPAIVGIVVAGNSAACLRLRWQQTDQGTCAPKVPYADGT
eukprot:5915602-Amphidinium_carterae.1